MTEWTPERGRLLLVLHRRDPHHPARLAKRTGVGVDEFTRRLGVLLPPADAPRERWVHPLPAGHKAT
jgi:hypothetical protein